MLSTIIVSWMNLYKLEIREPTCLKSNLLSPIFVIMFYNIYVLRDKIYRLFRLIVQFSDQYNFVKKNVKYNKK